MKILNKILIMLVIFYNFSYAKNNVEKKFLEKKGSTVYYNGEIFSGKASFNLDRQYYENGKANGKWLNFYKNGNIKSIVNWKDGKLNGKYILYNKDGIKVLETFYYLGKEHGSYFVYHDNGFLRIKGYYENGKAIGRWEYFDKKGKLTGINEL